VTRRAHDSLACPVDRGWVALINASLPRFLSEAAVLLWIVGNQHWRFTRHYWHGEEMRVDRRLARAGTGWAEALRAGRQPASQALCDFWSWPSQLVEVFMCAISGCTPRRNDIKTYFSAIFSTEEEAMLVIETVTFFGAAT
jgi:hypothetical protein